MKITTDTGIYFTCLSSIRNRTNLAVFSSVDASIPHFPSSSKASIDGIHVARIPRREDRGGWRSIGWNRSKIGKIASRVIGSNVLHRLLILTAATITVEIFTIRLAGFWNHLYKRLCYDASLGSTDSNFKLRSWRTNFLIILFLVSRLLKISENVFDEIKLLQFIFDIEM